MSTKKAEKVNQDKSDDDFCSPYINEALNEAREIVTKGKASEKIGEYILQDSTSIKVDKTREKGKPVEVIVKRSTITTHFSDEEEDYLSSGSDGEGIFDFKSGKIRSRANSNEDLDKLLASGEERHTKARYHKKKGSFWTKQDEKTSGNDNKNEGANLEIDVFEQTCDCADGGIVIKKTWEAVWTVQNFEDLPDWLKDNEYLLTGHRPPLPSFVECFKSILSLHTETGNIWTHLIGCVAFFVLALWFLTRPDTHIQFQEKLVFSFFFLSAIICLGASFVFHTVSCHSIPVVRFFSKLDYVGISLLIIGSFIPWIYYGFYCRALPKVTYITMIAILGVAAVVVSLWDKFSEPKFRPYRALVFVLMGMSGVFPAIHFIMTDGISKMIDENGFYYLIIMAILYLIGAVLYATRTPERFFPGKCDIWFQSHQLFHLCVVCAAFTHYYGVYNMAMNRLTSACPSDINTTLHDKYLQHQEL
ncbi:Adiponectin receptor protein [Strongyloides ratti]|uniref:Adiponectin receptor protein n=1 Tax=Strongyloides ratti TaxID=34506 RepID=A0A090KTD4_STRRB|nr:Adiponectin receptor protein [Strongyloides ratti]CEF60745.1 Adiponectin receptor protein [Strongyloides ratti]